MHVMFERGAPFYRITTQLNMPKEFLESFGVKEVGFSPNPFDPVIQYRMPIESEKFKEFVDYILKRE